MSLADEAPAVAEPGRYPSGAGSLELDLPATPDDPSMSPAIVDDLACSLQLHSAEVSQRHAPSRARHTHGYVTESVRVGLSLSLSRSELGCYCH